MRFGKLFSGLVALILALAGQTAVAQATGRAMTIESGGTQPGCVQWERNVVSANDPRQPQQVRVYFRLRNHCSQTVHVLFQHQTGCCDDRVSMGVNFRLAAGEAYGGPTAAGPYAWFNPPTDRYLNFWMVQSFAPFSNTNRLDMTRCWPRYNRTKPAPPCPPAFRL